MNCTTCGNPVPPPFKEFCSKACFRRHIAEGQTARRERADAFTELWAKAEAAGYAAGQAATPPAMVVYSPLRPFGDESVPDPSKPVHVVPDGPCGFGWVTVHPGTCAFARWAVKTHGASKEYYGGVCVRNVREFNQSESRKRAFADAFAGVLQAAGIKAYAHSRLD